MAIGLSPCAKWPNMRCPNRCAEPNCHMTCEAYLEWEKEKEEWKQKTARERSMEYEYMQFKVPEVMKSREMARKMKGKKT